MRKLGLMATAAILAFSSIDAAEQPASNDRSETEPVADAEPAASEGGSANKTVIQGVFTSGSTRPSAVGGTVTAQSGVRSQGQFFFGRIAPLPPPSSQPAKR